MFKKIYILLLVISFGIAGCIDKIDFELENAERQIVIYSEIHPGSTFCVRVSTSAVINTSQAIEYPDDAHIIVSNEGSVLDDNFTYRSRDMCFIGLEAEEMVPYTLEVSIPDIPVTPVIARTTIPASQKFSSINVEEFTPLIQEDGSKHYEGWVEFSIDQSNELGTDYFQVIPQSRRVEKYNGGLPYLYYNDYRDMEVLEVEASGDVATILGHKKGFFVNGSKLQGDVIRVRVRTTVPLVEGVDVFDHVYMQLNTLTYEMYNYNIIKDRQVKAQDYPLFEPIISYTNVTYGIGLFGAYNTRLDSVNVQ